MIWGTITWALDHMSLSDGQHPGWFLIKSTWMGVPYDTEDTVSQRALRVILEGHDVPGTFTFPDTLLTLSPQRSVFSSSSGSPPFTVIVAGHDLCFDRGVGQVLGRWWL
jgi:hypothetical protein